MSTDPPFEDYAGSIEAYIATRPDMSGVRAYNHQMLDIFDPLRPLAGRSPGDIGASPHGFALEWALRKDVSSYTGIGLGIHESVEVARPLAPQTPSSGRPSLVETFRRLTGTGQPTGESHQGSPAGKLQVECTGSLRNMDAEALRFESGQFDLIGVAFNVRAFFRRREGIAGNAPGAAARWKRAHQFSARVDKLVRAPSPSRGAGGRIDSAVGAPALDGRHHETDLRRALARGVADVP